MFRENILILDTDTLSPQLLDLPFAKESYSLLFFWDNSLFESRFVSHKRQAFIYEALSALEEIILIEGESKEILAYLKSSYPEVQIFYASRFKDRFEDGVLKQVEMRFLPPKIEPLPRGFFPFYKKLMKKIAHKIKG